MCLSHGDRLHSSHTYSTVVKRSTRRLGYTARITQRYLWGCVVRDQTRSSACPPSLSHLPAPFPFLSSACPLPFLICVPPFHFFPSACPFPGLLICVTLSLSSHLPAHLPFFSSVCLLPFLLIFVPSSLSHLRAPFPFLPICVPLSLSSHLCAPFPVFSSSRPLPFLSLPAALLRAARGAVLARLVRIPAVGRRRVGRRVGRRLGRQVGRRRLVEEVIEKLLDVRFTETAAARGQDTPVICLCRFSRVLPPSFFLAPCPFHILKLAPCPL